MRANMLQDQNRKSPNPAAAAAGVFILTAACYLASFSGLPISDDEELYASAARNLVVSGRLSAEQLYGNLRLAGSYHGVEPAFPALASLWYRLFLHSGLGHLQTLYLLPVMFTALSAALIVVITAQLGFSRAVGAAAALFYGVSSMAWPYAKTLFREPLIGLLLLGSLSAFLSMVHNWRRAWRTVLTAILLVALLAVLTLTRVVMAIAAVALFIALPLVHPAIRGRRTRIGWIALGALAFALGLAVLVASLQATDANAFYRFTGGFVQDALARLRTISHAHLAEALLAPVLSPWKGLLFYSPVCLLGLGSMVKNARSRPELFILPFSVLVALLLEQALAYDEQWWTPTWGSRFLLPVIPLLVVASLPVLERWMRLGRGGRILLGCLFGLGVVIQLPAVLFNSSAFTASTYQEGSGAFPGALIWDLSKTPILAQWRSAASQEPDILLWRSAAAQPVLVFLTCALMLAVMMIALLGLRRALGERRRTLEAPRYSLSPRSLCSRSPRACC